MMFTYRGFLVTSSRGSASRATLTIALVSSLWTSISRT